jgi:hypothetical protein
MEVAPERVAVGVGLTVMVKVFGNPGQPFAVGVTTILAVIGELVVLVAVKMGKFPVPEAAKPILVAELVHVYVTVPVATLVKLVAVVLELLQIL